MMDRPVSQQSAARLLNQGLLLAVCAVAVMAFAGPANAHTGTMTSGGFTDGFLHPLLGWDHIIAMVAVGLWGAILGAPALWLLPVVFPLVMVVGGALGVAGVPIPEVETGIALSGVVLGGMVAGAVRPPLWLAALIVGAFGIFHGHAHGTELIEFTFRYTQLAPGPAVCSTEPPAADPVAFSMGFVVATGLLHLGGVAFGLLAHWPAGVVAVRVVGAGIALGGLGFLGGFW